MSEFQRRAVTVNVLKGGLGKSTITKNTAAVLGQKYRTLVVDVDDNGHLTKHLGFKEQFRQGNKLYEYLDPLDDVELDDLIYETGFGFDLLHSTRKMEHVELEMLNTSNPDMVMKEDVVDPLLGSQYDYIIFDTAANKTLMTRNAAAASGNLIIPLVPGEQSKDGLSATIERLHTEYNQRLENGMNLLAIVPNMINGRIDHHNNHRALLEKLNTHDQEMVQDAIPNFARIPEGVWNAIDADELDSNPKPGIRKDNTLDQAQPINDTNPNSDTRSYFAELADIIRRGEVQRTENIVDKIINSNKKVTV